MDKKRNNNKNRSKKGSTQNADSIGTLADMLSPAMKKKLMSHPEDRIKNMIKEARSNPEVIEAEKKLKGK